MRMQLFCRAGQTVAERAMGATSRARTYSEETGNSGPRVSHRSLSSECQHVQPCHREIRLPKQVLGRSRIDELTKLVEQRGIEIGRNASRNLFQITLQQLLLGFAQGGLTVECVRRHPQRLQPGRREDGRESPADIVLA